MANFDDFPQVSGILVSTRALFGSELTKLKYKEGDNKQKFSLLIEAIEQLLFEQKYLIKNEINESTREKLNQIVLLLLLNTELSIPIDLEEYVNITTNVPKISLPLLSNIITDLKLFSCFCDVIQTIPIKYSCEYYNEFIPCLENVNDLAEQRNGVFYIVKSIIISSLRCKPEDYGYLDEMLSIVPRFCVLISGITIENFSASKLSKLYEHMGFTFSKLFDLLILCDLYNPRLERLINTLLNTACSIAKSITLDIYCYWVEVDIDECMTLQRQVAEKAYLVMEKYNKEKAAKELIQLLGSFAYKPKDIKEIVQGSDIDLMVKMVNKNDKNQTEWFEWLIYQHSLGKTLNDERAMHCIEMWGHLCTAENVSQLLKVASNTKNKKAISIALKCASQLKTDELTPLLVGHFFENNFLVLEDDVNPTLVIIFNKLNKNKNVDDLIFELTLLILKNPQATLDFILDECLKNVFYTKMLIPFLMKITDVLKCNKFCINSILKLMQAQPPCNENFNTYTDLLNVFLERNIFTTNEIVNEIFLKKMDNLVEQSPEELLQILVLLNLLKLTVKIEQSFGEFIKLLFKLLKTRTGFLNHNKIHQLTVQEVVQFLNNKCEIGTLDLTSLIDENTDDGFITYYQKKFAWPITERNFLHYVAPEFNVDDDKKAFCWLLKILPRCVPSEWKTIAKEITNISDWKKMLQIFNDSLLFLAEFMKSSSENLKPSFIYCLQEYALIVKDIISKNTSNQEEIFITKLIVELLRHLPQEIKVSEGIKLIGLMTDRSLKSLNNDKNFVNQLCLIKEKTVCQIIAKKMLA